MSAHSLLSPSSSDRWSRCTGSVALCKDLPNPGNEASALGTAKHQTAYWCMMHTVETMTACTLKGQPWTADGFAGDIDDEFIEHVNYCLRAVRAIPGDSRWFEIPLDTSPVLGVPGQSGTADVVIGDHAARVLNVGDYKFGYGWVDVENNRQMLTYAAAALHLLDEFGTDYDTVRLWVFQPKRGEPRMWETTAAYVREFAATVLAPAAQEAVKPGAPLTPGDKQCQWCPARFTCAARGAEVLGIDKIEQPTQSAVEVRLAEWLDRVDAIEDWCRDVRAEALRRATAGQTIPGYKLIEGKRGNRRWIDESVAVFALKDAGIDAYGEPKVVSPTEAQRRLKAAGKDYVQVVGPLVEQPPGAPSLAKWAEEGKPLPVLEFGLEEAR